MFEHTNSEFDIGVLAGARRERASYILDSMPPGGRQRTEDLTAQHGSAGMLLLQSRCVARDEAGWYCKWPPL